MPAKDLSRALEALPRRTDPNLLVGIETGDDAAAYRLNDDQLVVETLDFFSPVVDDPYDFGRVAAANSLSDVYAMGAKPLFALNIVAFPVKRLGTEVLGRVLAGGDAVAAEAGIPIPGGHSVEDDEPKYGMVVTGVVHPDKLIKNQGARPGDVLFLTKPIGSGVLTTAIKKGKLDEDRTRQVIDVMTTLNRGGAEAMLEVGAHAATDVTGFGLIGHLAGMVRYGDGVGVTVNAGAVPMLDGNLDFIEAGICPGGTQRNLDHFGQWCDFDAAVPEAMRLALADAQTSGGLMIACPADRADELERLLREKNTPAAARIGVFTDTAPGRVTIAP